jgi:23S rRNA pseudouridine2605 synthase
LTAGERPERLQKLLAAAGLGSRRACEELIAAGRVEVNGHVARLGERADAARDRITVDGAPLPLREGLVYYLVNKPAGVVSTAADPQGRPTILGLVPATPRVFPVGRLDLATEGLVVLTNDGELAHRLTHPSFGVEKEYLVEVSRPFSKQALGRLRRGVQLDDGPAAPALVKQLGPATARVVVREGRNRLVRRMMEAVGYEVSRLVRTRVGPVKDASLAPGSWRQLTPPEVMGLWDAAGGPAYPVGRHG